MGFFRRRPEKPEKIGGCLGLSDMVETVVQDGTNSS
jgi:hypothetical protein